MFKGLRERAEVVIIIARLQGSQAVERPGVAEGRV